MSPDKALDLVRRFSSLQWEIRAAKARIARELDKCTGLDGKRLDNRRRYEASEFGFTLDHEKNDKAIHLREWYEPELIEREWGPAGREWAPVTEDRREECPHCYAAHLIVQERKAARKAFGCVKAAMTKTTPKPAILKECYEPNGL